MNTDKVIGILCILIGIGIFMYFQNLQAQKRLEAATRPVKEEIIASHRPRIITFSASWCGACQQLKPVLNKVMENYSQSVDLEIVNLDKKQNTQNAQMTRMFGVSAIPATFIFDRQGNLVFKHVGYMEPEELDKHLRKAVF